MVITKGILFCEVTVVRFYELDENFFIDVTVFREEVLATGAKSVQFVNRKFQFFVCRIFILQHTVKLTENSKIYCYRVELVLNSTVGLILAP
jgi:hypothetical protein